MKFMNMKRFASLVMAGVMTLSLATSAFAADDNTTVVSGTYEEIPIAVEIPATGAAQINPYKLPVSVAVTGTEQSVNLVGQQITTKPMNIKNQGEVKLDVNASLAVVPTGDVAIGTAKDTGKTMKVSLEVAALNDASLAVTSESETLAGTLIKMFADENTWANAATLDAPAAAMGATTVTPAKSNAAMAVLGASKSSEGIITYGKDSMALFRLVGDLTAEPVDGSNADDPWKATDGFSATIVFKFTPHEDVAASVTLDKTTSALTTGSETLTATFNPGDSGLTVTSWAWATSDATVANTNTTNTTNTATVAYVGAGSATITVTATLSDNSTVTAQCVYTNT